MSRRFERYAFRLAVLTAVLALLTTTLAMAQDWAGRGRVQGKVAGPDEKPLEGVRITLLKDGVEGEGPEPILTNKKGRWSFLGLARGNWAVLLDKEGYQPSQGSVMVREQGVNPSLNVTMQILEPVETGPTADEKRGMIAKGNQLLATGEHAKARAAFEEVLPELPEESQPEVIRAIASTYSAEGEHVKAREVYEKALGMVSDSLRPVLFQDIARTYYEEENIDQAIVTLEKSLEANPEDETTLRLLVDILVADGRETDAEPYMARLPEGSQIDPNTLLNMGINLFNEGNMEGALEKFDRAVQENPDIADVYYYRGLANMNTGDNASALLDFKKLLELEPSHASAEEAKQFVEYLETQ